MKIPVQNIYYLLCYAWNKLDERDLVKIDPTTATNLVDLFAKVLIGGVNHIIKRGFDRGYVQHSEQEKKVVGKIDFGQTLKSNLLNRGQVHCHFDELSYDILHNRILKSTIRKLTNTETLDLGLKDQLTACYHKLQEVSEIELAQRLFSLVQLNRNNYFYAFLMRVCELLYTNLLPTEKTGTWHFKDFFQEETRMGLLFEEFVRNFYRHENDEYKVGRENVYWLLTPITPGGGRFLPEMRTDISMTSSNHKIIFECKFTAQIFQEYFGSQKLRSEHLNQLMAYLANLPESHLNNACEAVLLYPTVEHHLEEQYEDTKGRRINIRTLNLNQQWQGIHNDLLSMIAHRTN